MVESSRDDESVVESYRSCHWKTMTSPAVLAAAAVHDVAVADTGGWHSDDYWYCSDCDCAMAVIVIVRFDSATVPSFVAVILRLVPSRWRSVVHTPTFRNYTAVSLAAARARVVWIVADSSMRAIDSLLSVTSPWSRW